MWVLNAFCLHLTDASALISCASVDQNSMFWFLETKELDRDVAIAQLTGHGLALGRSNKFRNFALIRKTPESKNGEVIFVPAR